MIYHLLIALLLAPVFWWMSARANTRLAADAPGSKPYRFGYFLGWMLLLASLLALYAAVAGVAGGQVPVVSLVLTAALLASGMLIRRRRRAGWLLAIVLMAGAITLPAMFVASDAAAIAIAVVAAHALILLAVIAYAARRWRELGKAAAAETPAQGASPGLRPMETLSPLDAARD